MTATRIERRFAALKSANRGGFVKVAEAMLAYGVM